MIGSIMYYYMQIVMMKDMLLVTMINTVYSMLSMSMINIMYTID